MIKKPIIFILYFLLLAFSFSCKKTGRDLINHTRDTVQSNQFFKYIIHEGQHYTDNNDLKIVSYDQLRFVVKFDSTSIYQTKNLANQEDINKLYGFSDNNAQHQEFSARFGWNWARGALHLYGYTYNKGERSSLEITAIQSGVEYNCAIKVSAGHYIFSVNSTTIDMVRGSTTSKAEGYKLYPYFGGDETAPHDIAILIKEL